MSAETTGLQRGGNDAARSERNARLRALGIEHDDLDMAIAALLAVGNCDDLLIARFKKRKLQIKDEIACMMASGRQPKAADPQGSWRLAKFFR